MEKESNQKGIILLFVLFAMLLLVIFCLTVYFMIRNKLQLQEYKSFEIEEIYSKEIDKIETLEYALNIDIIPIYNIYQLDIAGSGSYLKIDDVIYQCGRGMNYLLKDNIIVDIDEDLVTGKIGFNDYKLYSSSYYVEKSIYDIYYYKDQNYWKNIVYQKFGEDRDKPVENGTYLEEEFSILGDDNQILNSKQYEFMVIWSDSDGNLTNQKSEIQNFGDVLTSINQINVFTENYNEIKNGTEFYIFLKIGNSI